MRLDQIFAVTEESAFLTIKLKASHATATMAMLENHAVRNTHIHYELNLQ